MNLISPATRRRAARLVTEGLSVSMASDLSMQHTPSTDSLTSHAAFTDPAAPIAVADAITLQVHGWSTHLVVGHIYTDEVGYNARRRAEIFTSHGLSADSITALKDGVFTRGVLLDVAAPTVSHGSRPTTRSPAPNSNKRKTPPASPSRQATRFSSTPASPRSGRRYHRRPRRPSSRARDRRRAVATRTRRGVVRR